MENNENTDEKYSYVYLDFNGKLPKDVFQNQVFLRVANLHKRNPLVQVNDSLFKGTYDQTMGTNLFFEETDENIHAGNTFEKQTPICLKYFQSSTKLLNLHQVKIPQSKAKIPNEVKHINYNLKWNYKELLEKFENGTLRIDDIASDEGMPPQDMEIEVEEEDTPLQINESNAINVEAEVTPLAKLETDNKLEDDLEDITPSTILEAEYEQLNILARRPVKRALSPELVAECDKKYEREYEYHNIERQILQPRDGFKSEALEVNEDTLADCVDIDRCVLYDLIPASSTFPRILSKSEKEKVLTLENFDNLSLAGRYYVLQNIVDDLDRYVKNTTPENLQRKDEYGRTPVYTLEIYKKLTEAVRRRLQEIKCSLE